MRMLQRSPKPTKPVNLSVDARLLEDARDYEINLSALLTTALRQEIGRRWREENKSAFEELGKEIEENGIWSDGLRSW
jgi:antitoxin CcdA